jgi:uncharacterized membrane protein
MTARKISILAFFIALSVVGAMIKVPAIIGSVALDAFPALLASAILGGGAGAIVGGLGHMASALIGGMPMGSLHFIVAIEMALLAFLFAYVYRKGKKVWASIIFVVGNAFIAPLPFILFFDLTFYFALLPSLLVGSLLNTVLALIAIPRLKSFFEGTFQKKNAHL